MEPDPGPTKTKIINFVPENIDKEHIYFEEINGEKIFKIAYLNDCSFSLVTSTARFDDNYKLLSCSINVQLLGKIYKNLRKHKNELLLDDLFTLTNKYHDKESLCLIYDGNSATSYMIGENYKIKTSTFWVANFALKEEEIQYMDYSDKMIYYFCSEFSPNKTYQNSALFKRIENSFILKNSSPKTLTKKAI